jgi:GT2 family glycosyltransferase
MEASTAERAEWVLILHSDDVAKPTWLETMLSRIDACDRRVGTICSSWDNLFPDGKVEPGEHDPHKPVVRIDGNAASIRRSLLNGCWWHVSGCAIRTQTLGDVGMFDPVLESKGDWDWLLRCLRRGWSAEYVPRTLILYRHHHKSVSATSFAISLDLLDTLSIARRNADVITNIDAARFHMRQEWFLARRMARALSELQFRKMTLLMGVMGKTFINAVKCCSAKVPAEVTLTGAGRI